MGGTDFPTVIRWRTPRARSLFDPVAEARHVQASGVKDVQPMRFKAFHRVQRSPAPP